MTLLEFIDDHMMSSDITVFSSDGKRVGFIPQGDESAIAGVRDYVNGEIVKEMKDSDSLCVYVNPKPISQGKAPVVIGYPGELSDEAAFSADWRSREPKASSKQLSFLYKNIRLYMTLKKPNWPRDPKDLLRYEATDAMTLIINYLNNMRDRREEDDDA